MVDKRFRIVLAGCGSMAKKWVNYALSRKDTEIVGCVDIQLESAEKMSAEFALGCPAFTDLAEALRQTNANLVFDVTIPEAHKQVVTTAIAHGCNVIGEKPIATTLADAIEVERLVREAGRSYTVMQNRRFDPNIRGLQKMLQEEVIGDPSHMTANFFLGPHFGGFRELMDSPLLLDMAIHTFDQARFLLQSAPVTVYCHEFNPKGSWYNGNAAAICIFEMFDGSVFTYNGSWCAEGAGTSWQAEWRIVGTKGTAHWDGDHPAYCSVVAEHQPGGLLQQYSQVHPTGHWNGQEGHHGCLDDAFAALLEERPAETDCSDNLQSVAMVFAAIESARTGAKVRVDELMRRNGSH